eukprot:COSAG04_NODE_16834_length_487_cov_1.327320_1_plen_31_part_10
MWDVGWMGRWGPESVLSNEERRERQRLSNRL